jgi:hypothetical protein
MELTLEQHIQNISIAVGKAVGTYEELTSIRSSFNHISDLVLKPKEVKEEK